MMPNTEETPNEEMPKVEEVPQFRMPSPEEIAAANQFMQGMQQPQRPTISPRILWMIAKVSIGFTILMLINDLATAWMVHLIK